MEYEGIILSVKVPEGHYMYNKQLDLDYRTQERGLGQKQKCGNAPKRGSKRLLTEDKKAEKERECQWLITQQMKRSGRGGVEAKSEKYHLRN